MGTVVVDDLVNILWVCPVLADTSTNVKIWDKHGPQHTIESFMEFEVGLNDEPWEGRLLSGVFFIGRKTLTLCHKTDNDIHGYSRAGRPFVCPRDGGLCMTFGWRSNEDLCCFLRCAYVLAQRCLDFRVENLTHKIRRHPIHSAPRYPPPPLQSPGVARDGLPGGGRRSPSDGLPGGGGDCKGISKQTVVPSTDASKENTCEATFAVWGSVWRADIHVQHEGQQQCTNACVHVTWSAIHGV